MDETMKKCAFNSSYFVGIAALVSVNFTLFVLLLKPTEKYHQSIPEAPGVPQPIDTASIEEEQQTDPHLSTKVWTNLSNPFAIFANSQLNPQEQESPPGVIVSVTSPTEWASLNDSSAYDHTAIGAVIRANGGKIPATGEELQRVLKKLGDFAQLPIPFSAVALDSGLSHPRVVITPCPAYITRSDQRSAKTSKTANDLLGNIPANRPNLEGRLFLAANMEVTGPSKNPCVKTVEFISWNSRFKKFDFGVIDDMGESPVLKIVDGIRCFSCHKNKGPILGNNPWSNTTHDSAVRKASSSLFTSLGKEAIASAEKGTVESRTSIDGMTLLTPQAAEVDAGVRLGADILHNRKLFRALIRTPKGREALKILLNAIAEPGSLEMLDNKIRPLINSLDLTRFMLDATVINKAVVPSTLIDYNPGESLGGTKMGWCDNSALVAQYDAIRAEGKHGLSGNHLPSNPKAFFKSPIRQPNQTSDLISALMLARTIGLTEEDRKFLIETLYVAAKSASRLQVDPPTIARHVFNSPNFAEIFNSGDLPDRDDFKDRFVAGLKESMKVNDISDEYLPSRDKYTNGPKHDPLSKGNDSEIELIPTTSCLRCHDIRVAGKKAQSGPIPLLAFDPFNKTSREGWIATADKAKKEVVLSRMLKRMSTDQDMPPEDSLEFKLFRSKNPASFEDVKQFLESELKRVKGD